MVRAMACLFVNTALGHLDLVLGRFRDFSQQRPLIQGSLPPSMLEGETLQAGSGRGADSRTVGKWVGRQLGQYREMRKDRQRGMGGSMGWQDPWNRRVGKLAARAQKKRDCPAGVKGCFTTAARLASCCNAAQTSETPSATRLNAARRSVLASRPGKDGGAQKHARVVRETAGAGPSL